MKPSQKRPLAVAAAGLGAAALLVLVVACERTMAPPDVDDRPVAASVVVVAQSDGQVVPSATTAPIPPSVQVLDAEGRGVINVPVYFAPRAGSGAVSLTTVRTDALGMAATAWTLSSALGAQYLDVIVAAPGVVGPYTITATSVVGPPTTLSVEPDTLIIGGGESVGLVLTARDAGGHATTLAPGSISFTSSHHAVASIDAQGIVTGVGGGVATVRAALGTLVRDVPVSVNASPVTDHLTTVPTSGQTTLAIAAFADDRVWVTGAEQTGFRLRMPFRGATLWSQTGLWDLAHVPGEDVFYGAYTQSDSPSGVRVFDAAGNHIGEYPAAGHLVTVVVDPVSDVIFAGTLDGTLYRIARSTGATTSVSLAGPLFGVTVHPADGRVFVSTNSDIVELEGATLTQLRSLTVGGFPRRSALIQGGTRLVVVRQSTAAIVIDVASLSLLTALDVPDGGHDVAVRPDGARFALSTKTPGPSGVHEFDASTLARLRTVVVTQPYRLKYNASGYVLMASAQAGGNLTFIR